MLQIGPAKIEVFSIINITPDSFSDGGEFLDQDILQDHIQQNNSLVDFWDVGAESTAPMNQAIEAELELERFNRYLISLLEKGLIQNLSLDTYKPEVISEILKRVSKISLKPNKIIWNDVSGVFDADTIQVLKDNPDLMYVYSHNFVPQKNQTSEHMQFINSELDVPGDMIEYFQQFTDLWQKNFGKRCVYLDPCLGFAKTREQNQLLLQFLPELVGKFSHEKWIHWLIGMSRKSFLRFPLNADKNPTLLKKTEIIEALYWFEHLPKFANSQISIRIHDSNVLKAIQDYFELT